MLILSRNIGEVLHIGDDIQVTVVAVHGHQVRIGIHAPREVVVDRQEIANRKQHERASHPVAEHRANAIPQDATANNARPPIPVTRRRVSNIQSPLALPPTPEREKKPTLHIGSAKSKITSLLRFLFMLLDYFAKPIDEH